MRIAVINHSNAVVGGAETYLRQLLPALVKAGHELAFWHELEGNAERESVTEGCDISTWCFAQFGEEKALAALASWEPDVIYTHGLHSAALEAATQHLAPSVFFAHNYYGSCISGAKTFSSPVTRPCDLPFSWKCLVHYYPRRCGGLNPSTMVRDYRRQRERLALLNNYHTILVAGDHMSGEYEKYGLADCVRVIAYPIAMIGDPVSHNRVRARDEKLRLLFLGRMDRLKGGDVLLEALPSIISVLERPIRLTLAGDGPLRALWEQRAVQLMSEIEGLEVQFTGWLKAERHRELFQESDLLVLPSLWPEPFGLVGLEAGLRGVPTAAFSVGGIPDWLKDGVNGVLAEEGPSRSASLAAAIIRCLRDDDFYQELRHGAAEEARRFDMATHLSLLLPVLEQASVVAHKTKPVQIGFG